MGNGRDLYAVAVSPTKGGTIFAGGGNADGRHATVFGGGEDNVVFAFDAADRNKVRRIARQATMVKSIACSDSYLYACGGIGDLWVYDLKTFEAIDTFYPFGKEETRITAVDAMGFYRHGDLKETQTDIIVVTSSDGRARFLELNKNEDGTYAWTNTELVVPPSGCGFGVGVQRLNN